MTPQRDEALKILHTIKRKYPEKKVIAGGPHCKHYIDDIIKTNEPYDYLVPLDGEKAIVGILSGQTSKFSNKYMRMGVKDGRHLMVGQSSDTRIVSDIMNKADILNSAPPDRTSKNAIDVIKQYHYTLGGKESTTMMTARGCPEHCTFCEDAMTAVKWSSMPNIIKELDDIVNLGYEGVYIFDDLFAIAKPMIEPILKEIKERKLIFRANAQARYFTKWGEDMAMLLADSGCYEIAFGAETGSQKILDNIQKRTTIEMNYKTVDYAAKHGIIVKAFMLLGLPGEDEETFKQTETFVKYLMNANPKNDFGAYVYMPYKGTQIRDNIDRGEKTGIKMLKEEVSGAYGIKGGETAYEIRTDALTGDRLQEMRNYLVNTYRPVSHAKKWEQPAVNQEMGFFDTHLKTKTEYD